MGHEANPNLPPLSSLLSSTAVYVLGQGCLAGRLEHEAMDAMHEAMDLGHVAMDAMMHIIIASEALTRRPQPTSRSTAEMHTKSRVPRFLFL